MKNNYLRNNLKIIHQYTEFMKDNYGVKSMGIFGSIARGEHSRESDIDILVEFSKPIGFFKFIGLELFLAKVLKRKVDLVTKRALKPLIKQRVLKETIYI